MNTIKVKTTQNVEVEYAIASVGDRILAYLIDMVVGMAWFLIGFFIVGIMSAGGQPNNTSFFIVGVIMLLPYLLYHLLCEIFMNGQSIGKKAKDIKVIKLNGHAPSLGDYLLRWIFRIIDVTLYGIVAIVTIAINGKGQRLGDLAAGTSVIKTVPVRRQDPFKVKLEEDYHVVFPEVTHLTDQDMALVRKLLFKAIKNQNELLLNRISTRLQEVIGVQPHMTDRDFLKTVIKDYYHLTAGVEA
ncbi:MAG: RDD family protein [Rufibacter sp.]